MEERPVGDAEVDICSSCNAAWIDWFDGEISTVARATAVMLRTTTGTPLPAEVRCPRCDVHLVRDAELRCPACFGIFVTRADLDVLGASGMEDATTEEPSLYVRIAAAVRKMFGRKD